MRGWKGAVALAVAPLLVTSFAPRQAAAQDADDMVEEAMRAAPEEMAANAAVVDWDGNLLREGTNGYTCMPSPPGVESAPMCLDDTWMNWAQAWQGKTDPEITEVGIAYMLAGDAGASNADPYATDAEAVDDWVVAPSHLMLLFPDAASYEAFPTDPSYGGPWVMWKGTPYVHLMVPLSEVEYEGHAGM